MDRIVGAGQTVQVDARFEGAQSWSLFDKPATSGADIAAGGALRRLGQENLSRGCQAPDLIDGDGRPELVAIAGNGFELLVLGTSDDALVELKRLGANFGVSGPMVIDDLDGDGFNDVILVQPSRVQVLRNRGSLEFDPPAFLPLWGLQTPVDAFVADYDDDGRRDLLVIGDDAGMLAYFGR